MFSPCEQARLETSPAKEDRVCTAPHHSAFKLIGFSLGRLIYYTNTHKRICQMLKSEAVSYRLSIGEVGNLASKGRDRDQEVAPTAKAGIATRRSLLQRRPGSRPGGRSYSEGRDRDQEVAPTAKAGIATRRSLLQRRPGSRPGSRSYSEGRDRDQEVAPTAKAGIATRRSLLQQNILREKSKLQEN